MNKWRPKDWDTARISITGDVDNNRMYYYEAGADAMLEALKKATSETDKNQPHGIDWGEVLIYLFHNRIVIIPDEV